MSKPLPGRQAGFLRKLRHFSGIGHQSGALLRLAPPAEVAQMLRKLGVDSMTVAVTERAMAANEMVQYRY